MVDNIMSPVQVDVLVIKQAYLKGRESGWYYGDEAVISVSLSAFKINIQGGRIIWCYPL